MCDLDQQLLVWSLPKSFWGHRFDLKGHHIMVYVSILCPVQERTAYIQRWGKTLLYQPILRPTYSCWGLHPFRGIFLPVRRRPAPRSFSQSFGLAAYGQIHQRLKSVWGHQCVCVWNFSREGKLVPLMQGQWALLGKPSATKQCLGRGSTTWPVMCTCNITSMVIFVETGCLLGFLLFRSLESCCVESYRWNNVCMMTPCVSSFVQVSVCVCVLTLKIWGLPKKNVHTSRKKLSNDSFKKWTWANGENPIILRHTNLFG